MCALLKYQDYSMLLGGGGGGQDVKYSIYFTKATCIVSGLGGGG